MQAQNGIGEVKIEGNRATLAFNRVLSHPTHEVWDVLTDPTKFNVWYNAQAAIDARVGGQFEVQSGPFNWSGPITEWSPPRVFAYEHNHEPRDEMPTGARTLVRWELREIERGTHLTFTQQELASTDGFAPGTHVVLDSLEAFLDGAELPDFGELYQAVEPLYAVWNAEDEVERNDSIQFQLPVVDQSAELRKLDVFIGKWINQGYTVESPSAPSLEILTSDVYEWMPGGFFVLHTAYGRIGNMDVGGTEILGYDADRGVYFSRFYDSRGGIHKADLSVAGESWTWRGHGTGCTAIFTEAGKVQTAHHVMQAENGQWVPSMEVVLTKIA
ncbi:MAG: SRPBCC domain-containing protein [Nitrolancea sp.]